MKPRHLIILAAVFAALLAVNAVQKIGAQAAKKFAVPHEEWRPDVLPESVERVVLTLTGFPELVLIKQADGWKVASLSNVRADTKKIETLLSAFSQTKAELRAEGEELYPRFAIGDKESFRLQVFAAGSKAVTDFWISPRRSGNEIFIRLPGKPKIYAAPGDLAVALGFPEILEMNAPQQVFFADLRLVPSNFEQIQRFDVSEIKDGKKILKAALERPSSEAGTPWEFVDKTWPYAPGAAKIEQYLNLLVNALAENVSMNADGFEAAGEIMLRDGRGKVLRLEFSNAGGRWRVRREGEAAIFEISEALYKEFQASDAALTAENPLEIKIDEEATVELTHDGRKEVFSKESGWPSAMAIQDAVTRLSFAGTAEGKAGEISKSAPTHVLRIVRPEPGKAIELRFYYNDPQANEIKTVIEGQEPVFTVSRAFFEDIFVPATPPAEEKPPVV